MSERVSTKHDIQRDELNSTRPNYSVVNRISVTGSISMLSDGIDPGTGNVVLSVTGTFTSANQIKDIVGEMVMGGDEVGIVVTYGSFTKTFSFFVDSQTALQVGAIPNNGWIPGAGTWSYSSADDPTFVLNINQNVTGTFHPGQRIMLTQATLKYFIVTAVGGYSSGTTPLTLYGGTDYDLSNEAIVSPSYSPVKDPFGFPVDPDKWTVEVTDTSQRTQATPGAGTWYNMGSVSVSIPIGKWLVSYDVIVQVQKDTSLNNILTVYTTLSTANNSEVDKKWSNLYGIVGSISADQFQVFGHLTRSNEISLAVKASYYLNSKTDQSYIANMYNRGDLGTTIVRARCAYL